MADDDPTPLATDAADTTGADTAAGLSPLLAGAPSKHARLLQWVAEIAELAQPSRIEWCDGSDEEWDRLTRLLEQNGTFTRLNPEKRPNSFYARSDPSDVARVEDRTIDLTLDPMVIPPELTLHPP